MDKRKVRLRVCYLLDTCQACEKVPKDTDKNRMSAELREKVCGGCSVHEELKTLRPFLDGDENKREELTLTVEEFIQLHYIEKKTAAEIAEINGKSAPTIYKFKSKHADEISRLLKEKGLSEKDAPARKTKRKTVAITPAAKTEYKPSTDWKAWKEKYEKANELIEGQKIEIKDLLTKISHMQSELKETHAAEVHAACEDIENELADIRKENDMLREENARFIDQSHKDRVELEKEQQRSNLFLSDCNSLREENKHLRGLMKLWL